jgi:glucokinase
VVQKRFASLDYPSLEAIALEFVAEVDLPVKWASFAVAGPVVGGSAYLTNLPWVIDEKTLQEKLKLVLVSLQNDLEAIATAVPYLMPDDLETLREGKAVPGGAIAVIAPGTGLGEAYLTWDGLQYRSHASEGGHADFAPTTSREIELLRYLQQHGEHVSVERVCAGRSIPDLYDFLKETGGAPESQTVRARLAGAGDRTPIIMAAGLDSQPPDPLSRATMELFLSILASETGNLALKVLSTGGIYLSGGIPPRIMEARLGVGAEFLATFEAKGRLAPILTPMPIHVIVKPVALLGAAIHGLDLMNHPWRDAA